ncbi:hypothetical protein WME79_16215 [Sorangium sp. So ce726]|uniref:hypothetical protein n=1 Tax=Sorangium sp. So ce726 TaxID=3133319 RepID=UPI003F5FC74A
MIAVRIVDIKGLYSPGFPGGSASPGTTRAAGYSPGYTSLDNQGRVYINRDLDGRWTRNTQLIEITAEVTSPDGELAQGARIRWRARDPDDPFNERPEVHPDWAPTLDENDYSAEGAYVGPTGEDNEGTEDSSPGWEEVEGYALSDATETTASTAIVGGRSTIRRHMTDIAGDNLILRAEIDAEGLAEGAADETGIMTLWRRIDVEYIRMESAPALPLEQVPAHLDQVFTQFDFSEERVIEDRQHLAPDAGALGEQASRFVSEIFSHAGEPGWFCLIAALEPHPLPDAPGEVLFRGTVAILDGGEGERRREFVEIPGDHPDASSVSFRWDGYQIAFGVASAIALSDPPRTRLWLEPHDIQSQFTAGDGSLAHAYRDRLFFFPRARRSGAAWEPPGYGIPARVQVEVRGEGAAYAAGMSPTIELGSTRYFAGRTILFTHHRAFWDPERAQPRSGYEQRTLHTIVHELTHAFGMPHKCGFFDYRTPRQTTCCMNYRSHWMIGADQQLIPGTAGQVGEGLCGRHMKETRRVRLENNRGLRWR